MLSAEGGRLLIYIPACEQQLVVSDTVNGGQYYDINNCSPGLVDIRH